MSLFFFARHPKKKKKHSVQRGVKERRKCQIEERKILYRKKTDRIKRNVALRIEKECVLLIVGKEKSQKGKKKIQRTELN